jgi:DNA-binding NtrC family response regulator
MPHVLVCDDDTQSNAFISGTLSQEGYDVVSVQDRREALRELSAARFKVLLLGVQGETQGVKDFILLAKALHRDLAFITIVDTDSIEMQRMIREEKVFYHLVKPFDEKEIKAVVQDAVAKAWRLSDAS